MSSDAPTDEQRRAVMASGRRVCVDAGAGSGKTRVLVARIMHLLQSRQADLDEIVAITFTEKAAGEMKERLRGQFRRLAPADDPEEMNRWRDLERRTDSARVSTIHSFCASLLRENALRLGLDPDFAILDETEAVLLVERVVSETVHALLDAGEEAAVRLATEFGTKRLIETLKGLLKKGDLVERAWGGASAASPEDLTALWVQTLEEERERVLMSLRRDPKVLRYCEALAQFEGKCSKETDGREALRHVMLKGLGEIVRASKPKQVEAAAASIFQQGARGVAKKNWESPEVYERLKALQDEVKDWLGKQVNRPAPSPEIEVRSARLTLDLRDTHGRIEAAYQQAKAEANTLDFNNLIALTLRMLRDDEDLCGRVARGIAFLLMDEFQDTNHAQLDIVRLLASHEEGPALFVVGDAKQSIYRFLGAEVEVFREEQERSEETVLLSRNFRSLPDVMAFVNGFFESSGLLHAVADYGPMQTHRESRCETRVEFLISEAEPRATAEDFRRLEADNLAARVQELVGGEAPVAVYDDREERYRDAAYGDVALLFRSMTKVYLYEEALRRRGIPYSVLAGQGFYELQEVLDLVNLLKVAVHPWDEVALLGFLRSPLGGLSDETVFRLCEDGNLAKAFESNVTVEDVGESERLSAARDLVGDLRTRTEMPLGTLLRRVLDVTGFEAILLAQHLGLQRVSNVRKLVTLGEQFGHRRPASLRSFLQYLDEAGSRAIREGEAGLQPQGAGAVTLMSVHMSKGLEFPITVLPSTSRMRVDARSGDVFLHRQLGMAVKTLDSKGEWATPALGTTIQRREAAEEEAERARLLYVAMTRARDYLLISGDPKADKGSWFEAVDRAYDLSSRSHGATVKGEGWSALVTRQVATPVVYAAPKERSETPDREALERRIGEPKQFSTVTRTFSISSILDYMSGSYDPDEKRDPEEEAPVLNAAAMRAMARGSLVHRMFELWDFSGDALPDLHGLSAEAEVGLGGRAKLEEDLRTVAERFRTSDLGRRLAGEPSIEREASFYLGLGEAIVSGAIDVLLPDGTIIDYKTGRHDDGRHGRYEWQLLLYAAAVRELRGIEPKTGLICYVDEGTTHEVPLTPEQVASAKRHAEEITARMLAGIPPG